VSIASLPWSRAMRLGGQRQRGEISDGDYCARLIAIYAVRSGRHLSEAELHEWELGELFALAAQIIGKFNLGEELSDQ
jgi:hypothetical protein